MKEGALPGGAVLAGGGGAERELAGGAVGAGRGRAAVEVGSPGEAGRAACASQHHNERHGLSEERWLTTHAKGSVAPTAKMPSAGLLPAEYWPDAQYRHGVTAEPSRSA